MIPPALDEWTALFAAEPACRSCGSDVLSTIADLGPQPAADLFPLLDDRGPDAIWPLVLGQCTQCHLLQLAGVDAPVPEVPLAVESETAKAHAATRARDVVALVGAERRLVVREFDSHHGGSWLPGFVDSGWVVSDDGTADVVVDVHGLVHDPDLEAALKQRLECVSPAGRFVIEFHHALALVEHGQIDTIRHGHPVYLSLLALEPALARHGFRMLHAEVSQVYGGSLLLVCGRTGAPDASIETILAAERLAGLGEPERLAGLGRRAEGSASALHDWLVAQREMGRTVLGYGAPSKAPVLLNLARVDRDLLPFTVDIAPAKQGRRMPVTRIPIRRPSDLVTASPDAVLILTWDIAEEVRAQLTSLGMRSDFYIPLPEPTVMG